MIVSLLSGGLRGIRLGTLIIRASIGAAVFTALAIGISLLAENLFPEFFSAADSKNAGYKGNADSSGSLVNLTLTPEEHESSQLFGNSSEGGSREVDTNTNEDTAPVDKPGSFSDFFADADGSRPGFQADKPSKSGSERSPEELAQAIHTVITKDEKG